MARPHLGKAGTLWAAILVPKEASPFISMPLNFPVWGMLEKIAVNLLAGYRRRGSPHVTSFLTEASDQGTSSLSGILPDGALQLVFAQRRRPAGPVNAQDTVPSPARPPRAAVKSHPRILREYPFQYGGDSLNCLVLGEDVRPFHA